MRNKTIISLLCQISFLICLQSCNLFDVERELLAEHEKLDGRKIKICYVRAGATTKDVIQVTISNQETPIRSFSNNCLKHSELFQDTILQLVLTDTGYMNYENKLDTINVIVK